VSRISNGKIQARKHRNIAKQGYLNTCLILTDLSEIMLIDVRLYDANPMVDGND
jgi:hypothetical protein